MRVLIVLAQPNPSSFCHAVQRRFADGLREAGHEAETIDLHAVGFDPVFKMADYLQFLDESQPERGNPRIAVTIAGLQWLRHSRLCGVHQED